MNYNEEYLSFYKNKILKELGLGQSDWENAKKMFDIFSSKMTATYFDVWTNRFDSKKVDDEEDLLYIKLTMFYWIEIFLKVKDFEEIYMIVKAIENKYIKYPPNLLETKEIINSLTSFEKLNIIEPLKKRSD